jgi:curved DNA-binding protein
MSDYIDYYAALGVDKSASQDEIRKAYRKQARKHHPDVNPDDAQAPVRFKQISEANEVLGDPDKRKKYDQYGKDWAHADQIENMRRQQQQQQQQQAYGQGAYQPGYQAGFGDEGEDFSDFFRSVFGEQGFAQGRRQQSFKGQDLRAELMLSLEDGLQTHKQTVSVGERQIRFSVPAGVEPGQTIRLRGHGQPGSNGGPAGDLYISFSFKPDPLFSREGTDLHTRIQVDFFKAMLGGEQEVPTLEGSIKLQIKPETRSGSKLRLRGKGYPVYKNETQRGDLYLEIQVDLPTGLSEPEKQLLQDWQKLRQEGAMHV